MELVYLSGKDEIEFTKFMQTRSLTPSLPNYIRFYALHKAYKDKVMIMHVDRHWHKFRIAVRNGKFLGQLYSLISVVTMYL